MLLGLVFDLAFLALAVWMFATRSRLTSWKQRPTWF
jgi:hypothetical protein